MNTARSMLSHIGQSILFQSIDIASENCGGGIRQPISSLGFMVQPEHFRDWKPTPPAPKSGLSERREFLPGHAA